LRLASDLGPRADLSVRIEQFANVWDSSGEANL
jgi:hypothetical protein